MISILGYIIGCAGFTFGAGCYLELRKWANLCKRGRIVIAYNQKVQINAPLTDWLKWTRMLKGDEQATGRVIYHAGKMSVAIVAPNTEDGTKISTVRPEGKKLNGKTPDESRQVRRARGRQEAKGGVTA